MSPMPAGATRIRARRMPAVSRQAGSHRGVLSGYAPTRATDLREQMERRLAQVRAEDLVANDWAGASAIDSLVTPAVGCGLQPQATLPFKLLGITEAQATLIEEAIEWVWEVWCRQCDWSNRLHFQDMQHLGLRTMLTQGDLLQFTIMQEEPTKLLALQLQEVHPGRLGTPMGMSATDASTDVRDGVKLDERGRAVGYYIGQPSTSMAGLSGQLGWGEHVYQPAYAGHRKLVFHCFRPLFAEQVRGRSVLEPGLKLFRQLNDALDYELVAQIITAAFPLFIERQQPGMPAVSNLRAGGMAPGMPGLPGTGAGRIEPNAPPMAMGHRPNYGVEPGGWLVGDVGDKPHVLQSNRPGGNFNSFLEVIMRAMAASTGQTYETLTRDFSKTTYSSARAALLEAWRTILYYRDFLQRHYCQPIWAMVWEEAWLRGLLPIPAGAVDFYDAPHLWTAATWMGPARGYIDPVKEVEANIMAVRALMKNMVDVHAEQGRDWRDSLRQSSRERRMMRDEGLSIETGTTARSGSANADGQDAPPQAAAAQEAAHA